MEKIKVVALKSFAYEQEIKTPRSEAFEVNKFEFSQLEALTLVKRFVDKNEASKEAPIKKGK